MSETVTRWAVVQVGGRSEAELQMMAADIAAALGPGTGIRFEDERTGEVVYELGPPPPDDGESFAIIRPDTEN
jgi:hypothetical protein